MPSSATWCTGKTFTALLFSIYTVRGKNRPAVVVAPSGLVNVWKKECHKHFRNVEVAVIKDLHLFSERSQVNTTTEIIIVSAQQLRLRTNQHLRNILRRFNPLVVLLDEASSLEDGLNPTVQMMEEITPPDAVILAITATPFKRPRAARNCADKALMVRVTHLALLPPLPRAGWRAAALPH